MPLSPETYRFWTTNVNADPPDPVKVREALTRLHKQWAAASATYPGFTLVPNLNAVDCDNCGMRMPAVAAGNHVCSFGPVSGGNTVALGTTLEIPLVEVCDDCQHPVSVHHHQSGVCTEFLCWCKGAKRSKTVRDHGRCTKCAVELSPMLDAYYGRDSWLAAMCVKCRDATAGRMP